MELTPSQLNLLGLSPERANERFLESFVEDALATDEFVAVGPAVIERAARAGCEPRRLLVRDDELFLEDLCAFRSRYPYVPGRTVTLERMAELIGMNKLRGMVAVFERPSPMPVSELLAKSTRLLVLEHVRFEGAQGSLMRSAAAFGFDGVLFGVGCKDPLGSHQLRASMGNCFLMSWSQEALEGQALMDVLARAGYTSVRLVAQTMPGSLPLHTLSVDKDRPVALIVSVDWPDAEPAELGTADWTVCIPTATDRGLSAEKDAAIAMWKLRRL